MSDTDLDTERKHLETLLKDRINFYMVFSPVYLIGAFEVTEPFKDMALWTGFAIPALMSLAIIRTTCLVVRALNRLPKKHLYNTLASGFEFLPNANYTLLPIPVLGTLLFLCLALGKTPF